MAQTCCVVGCEGPSEKDIILFKFPTSRAQRSQWVEALSLTSKNAVQGSVCSRHFLSTDYVHARGRTRLKPEVVPTIFEKRSPVPSPETLKDNPSTDNINNPLEDQTKSDKEDIKKENGHTDPCKGSDDKPEQERELPSDNETKELEEKPPENDTKEAGEGMTKSDCDLSNCDVLKEDSGNSDKEEDCDVLKDVDNSESDKRDDDIKSKKGDSVDKKSEQIESNCIASTPKQPNVPRDIDKPEDIEELLTNYHIKQNNIHGLENLEPSPNVEECIDIADNDLPFPYLMPKEPVFIEVAVEQGATQEGDNGDCLMLLESVQVELDPSELMLHDGEYEVASDDLDGPDEPVKNSAISLLTSSDEDDVIIQEPKIDTVEVSDETDEDDMPLVKLVKKEVKNRKSKVKKKKKQEQTEPDILTDVWGMYDYYCVECQYRTTDRMEFNKHRSEHTKVLLMCQICSYMTSSEVQLAKHEKQHKDFKRYQCHLCDYKAKHNMSLIYHLKSHKVSPLKCNKCSFQSKLESDFLRHMLLCRGKKVKGKNYKCDKCSYRTNRPSDLRRHSKVHKKKNDGSTLVSM